LRQGRSYPRMHIIQDLHGIAGRIAGKSPLRNWPVRVKKGLAQGARWTAFPYSGYWRGETEMDVEQAINQHGAMEGASCWDLGAHFGIYTVGMAMAVGSQGCVASFEPNPVAFAKCKRHVEMNGLTWVKLFNAGVSDRERTGRLIVGMNCDSSSAHLLYEDEKEEPASGLTEITLVQLDLLVESGAIRRPDFIKVDVEGHGAKALLGARRSILETTPTLVVSFHSRWELEGTKELLEPMGYSAQDGSGSPLTWQECLYRTAILRTKRRR